MTPQLRKLLFETLYKNRYLYRFASTVPFAGQWRVWQRLVLPYLRGQDVLEFGCGLGDLLADMLAAGYNCRAVEHSPQMVAAARDTLKRRHVGDTTTVLQGSAQELPFPAASFDSIVSTFPSEYIYDPRTTAEAARVLRPGGCLIIIEGANLLPVGYLQPFLVLLQAFVYGPASLLQPREQGQGGPVTTEPDRPDDAFHTRQHKDAPDIPDIDDLIVEPLPDAWIDSHIPLIRSGFQHHTYRLRNRRWEVYITIGEKADTVPSV